MTDELFLLNDHEWVKVDHITSDLHISHTNIAKYAGRPFDNSLNTYHMDNTLINNWNSVVDENETVLCLGDMALGDMNVSVPMYSQMNGLKYLVAGNHDGNSSVMRKRYKNKTEKIQKWTELYDREFIVLDELGVELKLVIDSAEYFGFASHYPPFNDTHHNLDFTDKFKHLRPAVPKQDEFVLHGHTHAHTVVENHNARNVLHMGVDAHDLHPVSSNAVAQLFRDYLDA